MSNGARLRQWGAFGVIGIALVLGGCGWLVPQPAELFPDEIVPGWRLSSEAALSLEALPTGAAGGEQVGPEKKRGFGRRS